MRVRAEWLEQLRPLSDDELKREEEAFEILCLYPLVELQETLIFEYLLRSAATTDPLFSIIKPLEKVKVIRLVLDNQATTCHIVVGMVLGLMRPEELGFFDRHSNKFSKRILKRVVERMREKVYLLG